MGTVPDGVVERKGIMDERECRVCGMPIDDLEQGTAEEERAYAAELCTQDAENELGPMPEDDES